MNKISKILATLASIVALTSGCAGALSQEGQSNLERSARDGQDIAIYLMRNDKDSLTVSLDGKRAVIGYVPASETRWSVPVMDITAFYSTPFSPNREEWARSHPDSSGLNRERGLPMLKTSVYEDDELMAVIQDGGDLHTQPKVKFGEIDYVLLRNKESGEFVYADRSVWESFLGKVYSKATRDLSTQ